jgi:hypothetical protein
MVGGSAMVVINNMRNADGWAVAVVLAVTLLSVLGLLIAIGWSEWKERRKRRTPKK